MFIASISGIPELWAKLKEEHGRRTKAMGRGLLKAGLLLQRYSQLIVPVDKGILKASAFTRLSESGVRTTVLVGYTANYAIYVHENLDAAHGAAFNLKYAAEIKTGSEHSRGENQQARFLIQPAIDHRAEYKRIIAEEAARG